MRIDVSISPLATIKFVSMNTLGFGKGDMNHSTEGALVHDITSANTLARRMDNYCDLDKCVDRILGQDSFCQENPYVHGSCYDLKGDRVG